MKMVMFLFAAVLELVVGGSRLMFAARKGNEGAQVGAMKSFGKRLHNTSQCLLSSSSVFSHSSVLRLDVASYVGKWLKSKHVVDLPPTPSPGV